MRENIWIRKENEEAWGSLKNKSAFVNNALKSIEPRLKPDAGPGEVIAFKGSIKDPQIDGFPLERACCLSTTRCVHWQFNQDKQIYINSLSGREREAE